MTLEGFAAKRPVVTLTDSGGPLEFVERRGTGLVTPPEPRAIADAFDRLFSTVRSPRGWGRPATRRSSARSRAGRRWSHGYSADPLTTRRHAVRRLYRGPKMDPRVAWVSPMPPASGIATYSSAVLEGLERIGYRRRKREMDVLADQAQALGDGAVAHDGRLPPRQQRRVPRRHLRPRVRRRGRRPPRPRARRPRDGAGGDGDPLGYQALRERRCSGRRLTRSRGRDERAARVPCVAHGARNARGIVVHSAFGERYLRAFGCQTPIFVVPHPVDRERAAVRGRRTRSRDPRVARVDGDADVIGWSAT